MLKKIRNTFLSRFFWGFIALYFLNISVDAPDVYNNTVAENLAINDQESIIELVVEKVFKYDNAIAELDDNDTDDSLHLKNHHRALDFFVLPNFDVPLVMVYAPLLNNPLGIYNRHFTPHHAEIHSPPPEV